MPYAHSSGWPGVHDQVAAVVEQGPSRPRRAVIPDTFSNSAARSVANAFT
jgi:hypothetical protein